MTAARTGNVAVIKALVARGANVRARERRKGQDALMWAAAENNAAAVTALIEAGADRDSRSNGGAFTPFLFAVRGGHLDSSRALLDAGVDVNQPLSDGTSPLVLAVMNAHYELAGLLLERGANPNADAQGWTALHQIAWSRRHNAGFNLPGPVQTGNLDSLELVRQLVKRGANVNARTTKEPRDGNRNMLNRLGSTAFLMAAKNDDVPMMRVLLEVGADPSLTTNRGTTALMVAAGVGIWAPGENPGTHEEALAAMKLALEAGGGDINDVDMDGETALHGAVYRGGNIAAIQFLIDKGAKLDVRNAKGWIPLTVADGVEYTPAVLKRYPEAAALLRKTMRDRGLPVPEGTHSPEVRCASRRSIAIAGNANDLGRRVHAGAGRSWTRSVSKVVRLVPQSGSPRGIRGPSAGRSRVLTALGRIERRRSADDDQAIDAAGRARQPRHAGVRGSRELSAQRQRESGRRERHAAGISRPETDTVHRALSKGQRSKVKVSSKTRSED